LHQMFKLCAGAPVPFDAVEIDRRLTAAHTLTTLADSTTKAIFDLYDHCALVVRFFIVAPDGHTTPVNVRGDRKLADTRRAHRHRAVATGRVQVVSAGRPAGFDLVAAPLHDGERVGGVLEFVVPKELVPVKEERLAIVAAAASSSLRAWQTAGLAQQETSQAAGVSFALGVRLAGVVMEAGELGAAARSAVRLLARELKAPVIAYRTDPSGQSMRVGPSSGLTSGHRSALETEALSISLSIDRPLALRELHVRTCGIFSGEVTIADGGPVVFVAGGTHPELERCGRDLASLLERLPVSNLATLDGVDDPQEPTSSPAAMELTRLRDLTPRENEILALLAGGSNTRQIARGLVISEKTVKTHVQNILRKLDAGSRLEAAAIAVRAGFVRLSVS
jgi:DNA-binding CsgD family transcriptional regulator